MTVGAAGSFSPTTSTASVIVVPGPKLIRLVIDVFRLKLMAADTCVLMSWRLGS